MSALPNPALPSITALDLLATPVLLVDAAATIRYVNAAGASWLGVSGRRILAQPIAVLGGDATLEQRLAAAVADGVATRIPRTRLSPVAGIERFADALVTPLGEALPPYAAAVELHGTSEFRELDPVQALPAALQAALQGLAHEVKNPLAGLRGAAQLLARKIADADAQRYVAVITAEADRLVTLVDRLLDPAPARTPVPVNVHEVLERVRLLAETDAGWSVVVQRDYDPSLPDLPADPDRLTQAIWNLVRNALQSGSSEVRLRTRAEHNVAIGEALAKLALRIDVIDNGRGVDDALGNRILLPLVSGRADGTGLGLPIAHAVAREHAGSLTFRSRPGHTVFTLLLPIAAAEAST